MSKEVIFKQSCLIRKNTPELSDKLRDLGYKIAKLSETEGRKYGILCNGIVSVGIPDNCQEFNLDEYLKNNPQIIDCGENEDLFLAIAALRNDSDYMQYFVCGDSFVLCDREGWLDMYSVLHSGGKYSIEELDNAHKATVEELIEHFKDNGEE